MKMSFFISILTVVVIFLASCTSRNNDIKNSEKEILQKQGKTIQVSIDGEVQIPDVEGVKLEKACEMVETLGLEHYIEETLTDNNIADSAVVKQYPVAGTMVQKGDTVWLWPNTAIVEMPDLANMPIDQAKETLTNVGLRECGIYEKKSDTVTEGMVISSSPSNGSTIRQGTWVTLYVSSGTTGVGNNTGESNKVVVPMLDGLGRDAIRSKLEEAGLHLGKVRYYYDPYVKAGAVKEQKPRALDRVTKGTYVDVWLTTIFNKDTQ
jgi:beta-lactam-binding protein with PASTA domain